MPAEIQLALRTVRSEDELQNKISISQAIFLKQRGKNELLSTLPLESILILVENLSISILPNSRPPACYLNPNG